jgi:competence protein ComEC
MPRLARRTLLGAALLLLSLLPGSTGLAKGASRLRVDFIDVGQGDAALITSPTGKTVLIDGGPHEAGARLVSFLRDRLDGPLDLVLLTHRHADHLGGLPAVIEAIGAHAFMDAPTPHAGKEREHLMRALERSNVPVRDAERGRQIELGGGATLTLLGPPEPPITGSRSDINANSVVARLDFGETSFLFMGDAEKDTERWLLAQHAELRARVLKVAHHGSRFSSTAPFLDAVRPAIAVISVGDHNDYHHPAPSTVRRLEAGGVTVYRSDEDGTVTIRSDGRDLTVATQKTVELPAVGAQ